MITNLKLNRNEIPATRAAFVQKWNNDGLFRIKAELAGFNVLFENVILPDGKVLDRRVK
jgi:hypothetical protein